MSERGGKRGSVVVTGTSSGIGRSTAEKLAEEGYTVFAGVRDPADGERISADVAGDVIPMTLDVTDQASIQSAAAQVSERTGGELAGLVNNAGTGFAEPLETIDIDRFREQLEVNLVGQLAVTQAFLPMLRAANGRLVFMGSIGGKTAFPFAGPYITSKHALEGLADSLRQELRGSGVDVALIEPGPMDTEIWPKAAKRARAAADRLHGAQAERYRERLRSFADRLDSTPERSASPELVAETVSEALSTRRPSSRYPVGGRARALYRVRPLIPDRVYDAAVSRL